MRLIQILKNKITYIFGVKMSIPKPRSSIFYVKIVMYFNQATERKILSFYRERERERDKNHLE